MITLVCPAKEIPDNYSVRKPSGQKLYRLVREIKIYGEQRQVVNAEGIVYLVAGESINAIKDDTLVAMDLMEEDAIEFLEMRRSHQ